MATPNEKLAQSLSVLQELQKGGCRVFRSDELSRVHRERLLENGFLQEVMKGWLISASPQARKGDSTPWYASVWEFCTRYCADRFGDDWHLSAEQSLWLHGERTIIPKQVVVCSPNGTNHSIELLFGTSIYDLKEAEMPTAEKLVARDGLRLFSALVSVIGVPESFFVRNPIETQVVLGTVTDVSDLLRLLLNGGHTAKAGYVAGALREIGRPKQADEIVSAMKSAGYDVRERNPFKTRSAFVQTQNVAAPIVGRMQMLWRMMREDVIAAFPKAPGLPRDQKAYLNSVDEIYRSDAYHSLSIEGYSVTLDLIEKVRQGDWAPDHDERDKKNRDALAARGYWQTFQAVKGVVEKAIAGDDAAALAREAHKEWYREMFQPCVRAGLIEAGALAGYRNMPVYLRTSRYVPPRWEAVRDAIPALFDLLEEEKNPAVRAVLGHWMFGYIHPYPDGNGRMARFLMNVMLASGGYPWTVIRVQDRNEYLHALDSASIDGDIKPFARFIEQSVRIELTYLAPEEWHDIGRDVVVFWGMDRNHRIRCAISREALDDRFHGDNRKKLEVFRENRVAIEDIARRKYLSGRVEPDGSVLVRTAEIAR
jgi:fido (protein-threonine AMPylation protein)